MTDDGLRARKKLRTHRSIAETAARLFAERGYEKVSVTEVARAADVSEQTVYNYFRTKEQLVTDRDSDLTAQLCENLRRRAPGQTPAAAVRDVVLGSVDDIVDIPADVWPGEIGHLATISTTVRRLSLDMTSRQAAALADAIAESSPSTPSEICRLQGMALAGVYQILFDEVGRRTRDGDKQADISRAVRPIIENVLAELDIWFQAAPAGGAKSRADSRAKARAKSREGR